MIDPSLIISGLAHCHLPGLYSLALSERQSPEVGMRRIFYVSQRCDMRLWDGGDFRLRPHNHRQVIRLQHIYGNVTNVMAVSDGLPRLTDYHGWLYRFESGLLGEMRSERMWRHNFRMRPEPLEDTTMGWEQFHTVVADPGAAWLVTEGKLAPEGLSRFLSLQPDTELSSEGLYLRMTRGEIGRLCSEIRGEIPE